MPHVCRFFRFRRQYTALKTGQMIRGGLQLWMVRIVRSRAAILLDQLEDALDAAYSKFSLASMYGVRDSADVGSCLVRTCQQLKQLRRRTRGRSASRMRSKHLVRAEIYPRRFIVLQVNRTSQYPTLTSPESVCETQSFRCAPPIRPQRMPSSSLRKQSLIVSS